MISQTETLQTLSINWYPKVQDIHTPVFMSHELQFYYLFKHNLSHKLVVRSNYAESLQSKHFIAEFRQFLHPEWHMLHFPSLRKKPSEQEVQIPPSLQVLHCLGHLRHLLDWDSLNYPKEQSLTHFPNYLLTNTI